MGRAFEYRRASKEKRWDKMSKVFPKLTRAITVAAREGGQDPESNPRLRAAIASAKAENMPKDNIETAIKRAAGRDAEAYAETAYEAKAAHGVLMIVDCATDNPTRTIANLKVIFKKEGGEIVQPGSLEFLFNRRTVVEFPVPEGRDLDEIELDLIDHGLEELEVENGTVYVYGDFTSFGSLSKAVERLGIEEARASLRRLPTSPVELTESQMEDVERLIDKLEDDEDVQAVFTNIA